ncbi:three-Cys-motif partner protein TcmP [Flavobacterium sp. LB2P6]|uniref:three-Cys-motif partner protein TcmP n=1 Tax=Flavobacterium sp. LB2P6 TaxID=3401714 RepID=UPI003AAAA124
MNKFGGDWTENKIEILVEYAKAYLTIMNNFAKQYNWKLLYFDGFAGSGFIKKGNEENQKIIIGAASRILEIVNPRPFDLYYFVEKETDNINLLKQNTSDLFPNKNIHIVETDCNEKIQSMSHFLTSEKGKKYKTLAYIDPCGMQLNWSSLQTLEKLSVDVWILVPTGMGVNRLLKKNGKISDAWLSKLEVFLGMEQKEILEYFYNEQIITTLFGDEIKVKKEEKAIEKSAELYSERLKKLFKFVSKPYILKNSSNSVMFHFLMASNNQSAVKVANEIVSKYNKA